MSERLGVAGWSANQRPGMWPGWPIRGQHQAPGQPWPQGRPVSRECAGIPGDGASSHRRSCQTRVTLGYKFWNMWFCWGEIECEFKRLFIRLCLVRDKVSAICVTPIFTHLAFLPPSSLINKQQHSPQQQSQHQQHIHIRTFAKLSNIFVHVWYDDDDFCLKRSFYVLAFYRQNVKCGSVAQ